MKKIFLATLFLLSGFSYNLAQNLECSFGNTPCSAFANADAVFIGTVTKVIQPPLEIWMRDKDYDQKAYVRIEKLYKGVNRSQIVLSQLGKRVAPKFIGASRYLFYANYDKKLKIWEVKTCTRTRMTEYANDDLLFLNGLPSSTAKTRVSGEITKITQMPDGENRRLADFKIKIAGENREYETATDKNGVYEIYGLPPGKYIIKLEIPSDLEFYAAIHSVPDPLSHAKELDFELKEGGCASIDILLIKRETKERIGAR
jgi:hypothetical protein